MLLLQGMSDAVTDVTDCRDLTSWSWNVTRRSSESRWKDVQVVTAVKSAVLLCVVLLTLAGNGLVITAVTVYRRLRCVTNQFIVSLALTDLTVALFVMPVSAMFELRAGQSHFTWQFCYFWISCDVTCCTSSRTFT